MTDNKSIRLVQAWGKVNEKYHADGAFVEIDKDEVDNMTAWEEAYLARTIMARKFKENGEKVESISLYDVVICGVEGDVKPEMSINLQDQNEDFTEYERKDLVRCPKKACNECGEDISMHVVVKGFSKYGSDCPLYFCDNECFLSYILKHLEKRINSQKHRGNYWITDEKE